MHVGRFPTCARFFASITLALSFSTDAGCGQEPVTVKFTYAVVLDPRIGGAMMDDLVHTINLRLDEAGKVRLLANQQVEVELYGDLSEAELKSLKRRISAMAMLEFRVLADSTQSQDEAVIAAAKRVPASQKQVADRRFERYWRPTGGGEHRA
jgi:hypothetical protein